MRAGLARYLEGPRTSRGDPDQQQPGRPSGPIKGIHYVLDFFAPKMLEMLYQHGEGYPEEELKWLRQRKIRAIRMADAFVSNGAKKLPYFLAWMLQADRDVRSLPLEVVNMCVPLSLTEDDVIDPERRRQVRRRRISAVMEHAG